MAHEYLKVIKCPYCDHEDRDSWEFNEDSGTWRCGNCDEEFKVDRDVEVTYSTYKTSCSEKNLPHEWVPEFAHHRTQTYSGGKWVDLPESDRKYFKKMIYSICDDHEYVDINKEEFDSINEI